MSLYTQILWQNDKIVDVTLMLSATLIMVWPGFVNCARIIHQFGIVTIMILDMLGQQTVSFAARNISRRLESRWIYSISLLDYSKSQINIWYFELVMRTITICKWYCYILQSYDFEDFVDGCSSKYTTPIFFKITEMFLLNINMAIT